MSSNTFDVKLTTRTESAPYNLDINQSTLEVLDIILEFKLATGWHLSRFMAQKDKDNYIYAKLRRIWQAGLLESFKVFTGESRFGMPLYYVLSKKGLGALARYGLYEPEHLKNYPKLKTLLSWGLKHEAEIVELASKESLNKSDSLDITFKGEASSKSLDYISDKHVEVLTPDYTVVYKFAQVNQTVCTEFERTYKSHEAMLGKLQRYFNFISQEENHKYILRLIFQTPGMETAFWLNIFTNRPALLRLNIVTTHLKLISEAKQFLQPVYASENTVNLNKISHLKAEIPYRIKLFNFL
jgi:hypothetical protein